MNRKLPRLILILLTVALVFALLACSPSGETPDNGGSSNNDNTIGGDNPPVSSSTINKAQIFHEIRNGLVKTGDIIDEKRSGTRYVDSNYTLIANSVNVGIEYQANYDLERAQDSEIMVRIFDYVEEANTMFIYYVDNDLYVQMGEEYMMMEGFGGTSTFKLFFESVTILDMEHTLFSVNFADTIEGMANMAESQNITKIILSDSEYNVSVKDVNLDLVKTKVNNFISNNIAVFGTRLDALTNKFMGFTLSDLGKVQIGRFNAEMLTVFNVEPTGEQSIRDFHINFAGNQANNIDTYYLDVNYSTSYEKGEIRLTKFDNPENNHYESRSVSAMHFVGDVYIPAFDQTFDAEIQGNFSAEDNSINELFIDIVHRTENQDFSYAIEERIFGAMYKDGMVYLDSKGLFDRYLGDFMSYDKLGLPRVQISGLNMSEEIQIMLERALGLLQIDFSDLFTPPQTDGNNTQNGTDEEGGFSLKDNAQFQKYISKIRSENGVFYLTIDNELIAEIIGESDATIVSIIANSLGLEEGLIKQIIDLGYFDNLALELAWDTVNDGITITARANDKDLFIMSLNNVGVGKDGLDVVFPDRKEIGYFDTFEEFENPETINVHVEGTIRTQGKENNDISKLMGLFIGDITGVNTQKELKVSDSLLINMDLWQTGNNFFVNAKVKISDKDGVRNFVDICSDINNPDDLLITNYDLDVKYKMSRSVVIELIGELSQNKALWEFETIVNALEILASDASINLGEHIDGNKDGTCDKCAVSMPASDFIHMIISPLYNQKTGEKLRDPLYDILGVEDFIAELKVNIDFDAPTGLADASEYVTPVVNIVEEESWATRYEAKWVESASVSFATKAIDFVLTFDPDSVNFVTGQYEYYPTARLLGYNVTYRMYITDIENGTKRVKELYDGNDSTYYQMVIDPAVENPIPDTIYVQYEDGSFGYLPYEFVDFPYNNSNVQNLMGGLKKDLYKIVIGKGSISEEVFDAEISVIGRNFKVGAGDYYNNIPIVARVKIDPYQYAIEKRAADARGESYYPFKYREENDGSGLSTSTLVLSFYDHFGSSKVINEYLTEFDWGFNENMITYSGGEYTLVQKYKTLDMAIVVKVQAKKVSHVQINSENPGYYTIDSLVTSTYTIPAITDENNEVRIYFETGHYRIIGNEPQDYVNTDPLCDGYYDKALDWSIKEADNVTIDRSVHPLNNGKTKYTTCTFGDAMTGGTQAVTLEVVCPTRVIGTRALTTVAYTSIQYLEDGVTINSETTVREAVKVSLASFSANESVESDYFDFDPYSTKIQDKSLPSMVYVKVVYQGREQVLGYPVTWIIENNILKEEGDNVIVKNAFAEESFMRVRGVIGDGELTQTLEMVIHNHSIGYSNIRFYNSTGELESIIKRYNAQGTEIKEGVSDQVEVTRKYFILGQDGKGLNPYEPFEFPTSVRLEFPEISGMAPKDFDTEWYLYDNGVRIKAEDYVVNPAGGIVTVFADVKSTTDTSGVLEQTIELNLQYTSKQIATNRIYGLASIDSFELTSPDGTVSYMKIDTYDEVAQKLYNDLSLDGGIKKIDVAFNVGDEGGANRTYGNAIDIDWINLDEFLAVLQSPLGSSTYYNMGKYTDDIIFLRGTIRKGTVQEQNIQMGFMVLPRVLGDINFSNFDKNLSAKDDNNVSAVILDTSLVSVKGETQVIDGATVPLYGANGHQIITVSGENTINVTFNKFFALSNLDGLCTPSEYVEYLFTNVSLSFADTTRMTNIELELPANFDDLIYGNTTTSDPNVEITATHVIFRMVIEKITKGSCVQTFNLTLSFLKDSTEIGPDEAYNEEVETFDAEGGLLYNYSSGYQLGDSFTVEYVHSGNVEYKGANALIWVVDEAVTSLNGDKTLGVGTQVTHIESEFFGFTTTRIIKLSTTLPNGQKFRRHINFYAKNVNFTKYHTEEKGLYQVIDGTIYIENVYDYLPLDNFIQHLPTAIIPDQTSSYISNIEIKFPLVGAWIPSTNYVKDGSDGLEFDIEKIKADITSAGLNRTLLATNSIKGYNDETQEIRLFVEVNKLSYGQISHEKYDVSANDLVYDQYKYDGNGTFVLPKDIKVSFGSISYQFTETDNVKYEIRYKQDKANFEEITELTYNNKGHTLDAKYGYTANEEIILRVTLPDGNNGVLLVVSFPNREIEEVYYSSKTGENSSALVNGIYYIDPYDRSTFALPTTAEFKYKGASEYLSQPVKWSLESATSKFTYLENGDYLYNGGDYEGASYLFYSSLSSFDDNDKEQFFVMQVYVLDRTLTRPSQYPTEYEATNPFAMRVQDLPSTLSESDFRDLSLGYKLDVTEIGAIDSLVDRLTNDKSTVSLFGKDVLDAREEGVVLADIEAYVPAFISQLTPVVPNVVWAKDAEGSELLVDDDVKVLGGFKYNLYGYVGDGEGEARTKGQIMEMTFYADTWTFNAVEDLVDNVVEFNDFTLVSILSEFKVSFIVTNNNGESRTEIITFYPEYYVDSDLKSRVVMVWNKEDMSNSSEQGSITFLNRYKRAEGNSITTEKVYKFDTQQVGIDELKFDLSDSSEEGYAQSGEIDIVIDPLNPVIPTKALARGKLNLDAQTLIYLGEVNVDWEITDASNPESIYNFSLSGGSKLVYCNVTSGDGNGTIFKFAVNVTYLNRSPVSISTTESGYTNVAKEGSFYPLMTTIERDGKLQKNYTFVVDPTPSDDRLFTVDGSTNVMYPLSTGGFARSNYNLPSSLYLTFANAYEAGSVASEGLLALGSEITLIDVEWVISRDISLVGTSVYGSDIFAKIRKFRVQYVANGETHTSQLYDFVEDEGNLGSYLTLDLQTTNRQVEYTYVLKNGESAILSEVPEGATNNYQQARDEFYIDPYNIAFPEDVYVIFSGSTIPFHSVDVEWKYDEDHLKKHGVITGSIGEKYMLIMAEMTVYGTTLQVQFPIRARNIPVSVETEDGQTTMKPLKAGTIYVLAGLPVEQQLPTKLYYRFDYEDGSSEIASVPLSFPATSVSTIQTNVVGREYSNIKAKLGLVDDDNVVFTVKVIDPKLYALRSTVENSAIGDSVPAQGYVNGGFVYDYIAIGVNAAGVYVPGPETNILPDRVIISEDGEYMEIMNIIYDMENMTATIECRYTFLSFEDSPSLSGDKDPTSENSNKMFLTFSVPIKSYSYNWLEETTAEFATPVLRFPLGTIVTASDMPLTVSGIAPIWELDSLNHNKAGEYIATCYYKNAYGNIITGEVTIIIERRKITSDDFTWVEDAEGINFRDRVYDGRVLNVMDYIQLGEFLREDGSYGPLNFSVLYSIDGRQNWQTEQPTQVKERDDSPDYFVRIIVNDDDDYNYTSYIDYKMVISKRIIDEESIYFYSETDPLGNHVKIKESEYSYVDKNGANASKMIKQVSFEYNGLERIPMVGGIPRGADAIIQYAEYDPNASQQAYNSNSGPINVGTYIMRVRFNEDQRNYVIGDVEFTILIHITKKEVVYTLSPTYEYTGEYFDVPVNGLPEVLGDIQVTYSYVYVTDSGEVALAPGSKIKDAGTYMVTVMINGGKNYPNANVDGTYTTLYQQPITVNKRKVILNVNSVSSEYLDPLKPFDSALTLVSASNPEEPGLIGRYDTNLELVFGDIDVVWTDGILTYKHMVGSYPLTVVNKENMLAKANANEEKANGFHRNYEFVAINDGVYQIVAERENTRIIENKEQLTQAIQQLRDGDTAIWYFLAGDYGKISINVNASVSIIGSYDLSSDEEIIAVSFEQVVVNKGAVLLDIVKFKDIANDASVKLGKDASSLTVSRSEFTRKNATMLTNSTAIGTAVGYSNTIYISDTYFMGYATAIYMLGGSLELRNSKLYQNMNGVYLQKGNLVLDTNEFIGNRGSAVNIAYSKATLSIFDNTFDSNDIAIKTSVALRNDIRVQNVFAQNTITFEGWKEEE